MDYSKIVESVYNTDNKKDDKKFETGITKLCMNNVVTQDKLRAVQIDILGKLSQFISATYGPLGSNTMIVSGNNKDTILAKYSKDGLNVLKNIIFDQPLEMAIHSQVLDIARVVEHKVGDGTTSSVILSSLIFKGLCNLEKEYKIPPRRLVKYFQQQVKNLQNMIREKKRNITIEDIYNICMISTNGNEEVSKQIMSLYEKYGYDVEIDVDISNDENTKVKEYDGLTIDVGYSDPAYINNSKGSALLNNPRIYAFKDPVDTPEMISYLAKIINHNIIFPMDDSYPDEAVAENEIIPEEPIPTVIVAPHISVDASGFIANLITSLYKYNSNNMQSQKPPVLIITNISGVDEGVAGDISKLCRCKEIRKYIDPNIQKSDQENGKAPTLDNIFEWYGTAEQVEADADKTKFINPASMLDDTDNTYDVLVNFLEDELKTSIENNDDIGKIGLMKKRLRHLKANMIEYLIGGVTISDRDAIKDLVEDAVKNCASASTNGVGYAANFEGLRAAAKLIESGKDDLKENYKQAIDNIIFAAYYKAAEILYSTATDSESANKLVNRSLELGEPFNVIDVFDNNIKPGDNVLCSIDTDIEILDTISKIITMMVTANQCLVQTPALNRY